MSIEVLITSFCSGCLEPSPLDLALVSWDSLYEGALWGLPLESAQLKEAEGVPQKYLKAFEYHLSFHPVAGSQECRVRVNQDGHRSFISEGDFLVFKGWHLSVFSLC